jgi:hypothetical protein
MLTWTTFSEATGGAMRKILITIYIVIAFISISFFSSDAEDTPKEVFIAAQEAHYYWLGIEKKIVDNSAHKQCMPSLSSLESSPYKPYPFYSITCENLQKCESGNDLISYLELQCYRAPLFYENRIEGFATLKYGMDPLRNVQRWHHTSFGPGSEMEKEYYSLMEQYPEDSGYMIYPFFFEYGSRGFFLIQTNADGCLIMPFSNTAKIFINDFQQKEIGYEVLPLEQVLEGFVQRAKECSQAHRN